tara:strand:- start:578 stop:1378 length:801 start_codon:yes stop_codon:yes gene_type:complete
MKLIHLSDPHIYIKKINGIDPVVRFKKALEHIIKHHRDADLFSITGDLTDLGDKASYQLFKNIIKDFNLPSNLKPQLIIGNHDNREIFKENFPAVKVDKNGYIQYFNDLENKRFIFIDTISADADAGHYCEERQKWLKNILNETYNNYEIYIFMHHNPLALAQDKSDVIGLKEKNAFKKILLDSKKNIKHIFFGHQHITSSGSFNGITFSSPRSTWSPLIPNFSNKYKLETANTDPNYNVILIKDDSLIVHSEDFLKTEVKWLEGE